MFDGMTTVTQGTVGVSSAIFEFSKRGWWVSLPINDNQPYDLVVDRNDNSGPKRIQVKTTKYKPCSNYTVQLKSVRSNKTKNINKKLDCSVFDELFILCDNGDIYCIPSNEIKAFSAISLGNNYKKFKLDGSPYGGKRP